MGRREIRTGPSILTKYSDGEELFCHTGASWQVLQFLWKDTSVEKYGEISVQSFQEDLKRCSAPPPVCLRDLFEFCMFSANKQSTRTSVYGWFSFLVESSECEHSVYAEKMVTIYSQNDGLGKSLRRFAWDSSREAAHYIIVGISR